MERALKCDLCSEILISRSKFNHHMGREHGKPRDLAKKQSKCDVCGKEFRDKTGLTVHKRTHTGERPFRCTVTDCGMSFKHATALKNHMRRHTGERPFKCIANDCEMEFKQQSALNSHIKFKHSDERPFKCNLPGCKYGAKTSIDLRTHLKKHCNDRSIVCPKEGCNFRTKHKSNLTRHLKPAPSSAKGFVCSEFDYKVTRKYHLKSHMRRRLFTRRDKTKCSHSECAEYLICSYDLECLLGNEDEASSIECYQSGNEPTFGDSNALRDTNWYVYSEPSAVCPTLNYTSYPTGTAADLHDSEGEKGENIEPDIRQTRLSLSKDSGFSYSPDVRRGRGGNEQEYFCQGFNWLEILLSSIL